MPRLGVSRQPMRFMSVDLPEPDGPMIATYSPWSMVKLTPRRAWISSAPIWYVRQRSSARMSAPLAAAATAALMNAFFLFSTLMRASSLSVRRVL